jgi:hypothetical protein
MLIRLFATTLTAHDASQSCTSGHLPIGSDLLIYRLRGKLNSWSGAFFERFSLEARYGDIALSALNPLENERRLGPWHGTCLQLTRRIFNFL